MALRDLEFLDCGIPRELDDLHTVQQRFRDRIGRVRRADKQNVRQVIGNIHIVIREAEVLLRIKHLQQRAGRISAVVAAQLVHLIQDNDRIRGTCIFHRIHDTPGHGSDVRSSVTSDLSLIPHAAKGDPHILPSERLRDALADTRLARSGRADEQKDRTGLLLVQAHDRKLLDDPVLDLLEAVMILIQDLMGLLKIDLLKLRLLPVKRSHKVKVVIQQAVLMAVLALLLHAAENLVRLSAGSLIHSRLRDLLLKLPDIGDILRVHLIELLLKEADLLLQSILAVELLIGLLRMLLSFIRNIRDRDKSIDRLLDQVQTLRLLIRRKDRKPLIHIQCKISTERSRALLRILPAVDVRTHHQSPRELLHKLRDPRLQGLKKLLPILLRYIPDIRTDHGISVDLRLRHDNIADIHAVLRAHCDITVIIHRFHNTGQADRVEILAGQVPPALVHLLEQKQYLLALADRMGHVIIKKILLKSHRNVRKDHHIINRNNNHRSKPPSPYNCLV